MVILHGQFHDVVLVKFLGQCGPRWRECADDRRQSRAARPYLRALTKRGAVHHNFLPAAVPRLSVLRKSPGFPLGGAPCAKIGARVQGTVPCPRRRFRASVCYESRRVSCQAACRAPKTRAGSAVLCRRFPAVLGTLSANLRGFSAGCVKAVSAKRAGFPPQIVASEIYSSPERTDLITNHWGRLAAASLLLLYTAPRPRQPVTGHRAKKSATGKPAALLNYDRAEEVKPRHTRPRPHRHGHSPALSIAGHWRLPHRAPLALDEAACASCHSPRGSPRP